MSLLNNQRKTEEIRFLEMVMGIAAWSTLIGLTVLSWRLPAFVAIFIILFDIYWIVKSAYLMMHLKRTFVIMKENLNTDFQTKLERDFPDKWQRLVHLVIIPVFGEPYEVVRGSIESLYRSSYPNDKLIVCLALESRGGVSDALMGRKIQAKYEGLFGAWCTSVHPADLPGEIPGKASNQAYACKLVKTEVIDRLGVPYENIITSIFDGDTHIGRDYFSVLSHKFLSVPDPLHASYQPVPLFTKNIYNVTPFARIMGFTSTFWLLMQQSRKEQLTSFSSHSTPWQALVDVGFHHPYVVAEDSRIFFQCLTHYKGNWRVEPLVYPVYMDAVFGHNFKEAAVNLYKQQRRWAWGVENLPYFIQNFLFNKEIPGKIKRFWAAKVWSGLYSWSTASLIIFFFGWMPNLLGGEAFKNSVLSYNLPGFTSSLMNVSVVGILISALLSLTLMPKNDLPLSFSMALKHLLGWILTPVAFIVFSALPALESQTRLMLGGKYRLGFWRTPKNTKEISTPVMSPVQDSPDFL